MEQVPFSPATKQNEFDIKLVQPNYQNTEVILFGLVAVPHKGTAWNEFHFEVTGTGTKWVPRFGNVTERF